MNENKNTGADNVTAGKLPDGWKIYDKYLIRHADGTPLKGKRYFVLRLDSDDPLEAARVAAAMSAYKGEAQLGNAAKLREVVEMFCAYSAVVLNTGMFNRVHLEALLNKAKAALAAPPRNCDVGTAEEQLKRFEQNCGKEKCRKCPLLKYVVEKYGKCDFVWAQMPYNESEAGK